MRTIGIILFSFILNSVLATDPYPRNDAIDIQHYSFSIEINDSTNRISGKTDIRIFFNRPITDFSLDLVSVNASGQGMTVKEIRLNNLPITFSHQNDRLKIQLSKAPEKGDEMIFSIIYEGIPQDGLIIGKNKFGDRTFFGDNWPNRAHHWLPTIDHPYDKASCEFIITAPDHYAVIATGEKIEESAVAKNRKLTHWKTEIILPTKVMVFGAARFAIEYHMVKNIALQSWVYPQNKDQGFRDYSIAAKPLLFFSEVIAPYPYEKLANVQSTTRYGGMENAGNIFYYENSVNAKNSIETIVAHEVAHQWFGDSASEDDWYHVWLSEGFSTYLANLYLEHQYGSKRLEEEEANDRKEVIDYYLKNPTPIVNTHVTDLNSILNTNSYQKGAWVLHMLRHEVGDQFFWSGIREYYQNFQLDNALTDDFRLIMERVSGKDLKAFFDQWIFKAGHPKIEVTWKYDTRNKNILLTVEQKQAQLFVFPLELEVSGDHAKAEKVQISAKKQTFSLFNDAKPSSIALDPNIWLLFEGTIQEASR